MEILISIVLFVLLCRGTFALLGILGRVFGGILGFLGFVILAILAVTVFGLALIALPVLIVAGLIAVGTALAKV